MRNWSWTNRTSFVVIYIVCKCSIPTITKPIPNSIGFDTVESLWEITIKNQINYLSACLISMEHLRGIMEYYGNYIISDDFDSIGKLVPALDDEYIKATSAEWIKFKTITDPKFCQQSAELLEEINNMLWALDWQTVTEFMSNIIKANSDWSYDITDLRVHLTQAIKICEQNKICWDQAIAWIIIYYHQLSINEQLRYVYRHQLMITWIFLEHVLCVDQWWAVLLQLNQLNALIYEHSYNEMYITIPFSLIRTELGIENIAKTKWPQTLSYTANEIMKHIHNTPYSLQTITLKYHDWVPTTIVKVGKAKIEDYESIAKNLQYGTIGFYRHGGKKTHVNITEEFKFRASEIDVLESSWIHHSRSERVWFSPEEM